MARRVNQKTVAKPKAQESKIKGSRTANKLSQSPG